MSHLIKIYAVCKFGYFHLCCLTLLHSERPKLYTILALLTAIGLKCSMETLARLHGFIDLFESSSLQIRRVHFCVMCINYFRHKLNVSQASLIYVHCSRSQKMTTYMHSFLAKYEK